jgi:hypothetical protein
MERRNFPHITGGLLILGAVLGLILSIGGLIVLWSTRVDMTRQTIGTIGLIGDTLTATHETISVISNSLDQAETSLVAVHQMILDVSNTLDKTGELISSTGDVLGNKMVSFLANTQSSLVTVENSAKAVDSILTKINSIPLIGGYLGGGYRPDLPLQESVAKVNKSMDPLPESLKNIQQELEVSSANVETVRVDLAGLATQIDSIQSSIKDAQKVVIEYQRILSDMQERYDRFEKRLPGMINGFYIGMTTVLTWVLITQFGTLLLGIELLK